MELMPKAATETRGRPRGQIVLRSAHPEVLISPQNMEEVADVERIIGLVRALHKSYGWLTGDLPALRTFLLNRFAELATSDNLLVATRASELLGKYAGLFDERDKELPASPDGAVAEILARVRGILLSPAAEPTSGNGHQAGELPIIDVHPDVVDNKG